MEIIEPKFIDPEVAAHNIATVICNQVQIPLPKVDFDAVDFGSTLDIELQSMARSVANLYALAYDAAFDEIQDGNNILEDD